MKHITFTLILLTTLLLSSCSQVEKSETNVVNPDNKNTQESISVSEPQPQTIETDSANY